MKFKNLPEPTEPWNIDPTDIKVEHFDFTRKRQVSINLFRGTINEHNLPVGDDDLFEANALTFMARSGNGMYFKDINGNSRMLATSEFYKACNANMIQSDGGRLVVQGMFKFRTFKYDRSTDYVVAEKK